MNMFQPNENGQEKSAKERGRGVVRQANLLSAAKSSLYLDLVLKH